MAILPTHKTLPDVNSQGHPANVISIITVSGLSSSNVQSAIEEIHVNVSDTSNTTTLAYNQANVAYNSSNNNANLISIVYDQANTATLAYDRANSAYDTANNKFSSSGGTISGDVAITGNVVVQGTTTTLNVDVLNVKDKNIVLANVTSPTNLTSDGAGITVLGATEKTWNWVNTTSSWTSSENIDIASGKGYRISNIDVLTSNTLGSGIVNSSLTSIGTLTSLNVSGKVGIGNTSPVAKLVSTSTTEQLRLQYDETSTHLATFTVSSVGSLTLATSSGFFSFPITADTSTVTPLNITFTSAGSGVAGIKTHSNGISYTPSTSTLNVVGAIVTSNVYIGTTTSSYKLDVNGSAKANSLTLTANTPSTNTTTGTLIVTGGIGVSGDINISNSYKINGNVVVNSTTISTLQAINETQNTNIITAFNQSNSAYDRANTAYNIAILNLMGF